MKRKKMFQSPGGKSEGLPPGAWLPAGPRGGARVLSALLLVGAATFAQGLPLDRPQKHGFSPGRLERLGAEMRSYVEEGKLAGVLTLIARHGSVVHFQTTGMMDIEAKKPMRSDTIFRIYSMTKPITGVAVMMLYEEGEFLLTDPVSNYLPEFGGLKVYRSGKGKGLRAGPAREMTIKHLLTHTSGLIYSGDEPGLPTLYKEADLWRVGSLAEFLDRLAKLPLASQPGAEWHYGVSMDVLARLVEIVSGQRFDRFLAERIFGPLGMVDTAFYVPEDQLHRFAANYRALPDGRMERIPASEDGSFLDPDAVPFGGHGLVSTAADYLRFAQMLLNGGELDGVRILGRKSVDLMMANHLGPEHGPEPLAEAAGWYQFDPRGLGFGLTGGIVTDAARSSVLGTRGIFFWGGAASTHFWVDRKERLIGMVLSQLMPSGTYPIRSKMRILTYQALVD